MYCSDLNDLAYFPMALFTKENVVSKTGIMI